MEMRDLIAEDYKRFFRISQIENEGNDPAKSGKSYGTPHDLASLYGRRKGDDKGQPFGTVPVGYEDETPGIGKIGPEGGRPREHASHYGTNDGLGGRDPLGVHGMKGGFDSDYENVSEGKNPQTIDNTLAKTLFYQNFYKQDKKHNIFEKVEEKHSEMLDESKIKDLDKS
jgi:hypothetical protein